MLEGQGAKLVSEMQAPETPKAQRSIELRDLFLRAYGNALQNERIGEGRIQIELFDSPEVEDRYLEQYRGLLQKLTTKILASPHFVEGSVDSFLEEGWRIFRFEHTPKYGFNRKHRIVESLDRNEWDCDNSAFLFFDLAKVFGFDPSIVIVPGHALLKVKDLYFETTSGQAIAATTFAANYKEGVSETCDRAEIHEISIRDTQILDAGLKASLQEVDANLPKAVQQSEQPIDILSAYSIKGIIHPNAREELVELLDDIESSNSERSALDILIVATMRFVNGDTDKLREVLEMAPGLRVPSAIEAPLLNRYFAISSVASGHGVNGGSALAEEFRILRLFGFQALLNLCEGGPREDGLSSVNRALWLDPFDQVAHLARAELLLPDGPKSIELRESIACLLQHRIAIGHLFFGITALSAGDSIAFNSFDYFCIAQPTSALAHLGLALCSTDQEAAAKSWRSALELVPQIKAVAPSLEHVRAAGLLQVRNATAERIVSTVPSNIEKACLLLRIGSLPRAMRVAFTSAEDAQDDDQQRQLRQAGACASALMGFSLGRELLAASFRDRPNRMFAEPLGMRRTSEVVDFVESLLHPSQVCSDEEIESTKQLDFIGKSSTLQHAYLDYHERFPQDLAAFELGFVPYFQVDEPLLNWKLDTFQRVALLCDCLSRRLLSEYGMYLGMRNPGDRVALFERAISRYSCDRDLRTDLATAMYAMGGRDGEALSLLENSAGLPHGDNLLWEIKVHAQILARNDSPASAYRYLLRNFSYCSDVAWTYFLIIDYACGAGEIEAAKRFFVIADRKASGVPGWEHNRKRLIELFPELLEH